MDDWVGKYYELISFVRSFSSEFVYFISCLSVLNILAQAVSC
jgi:hypothetical protein